MLMQEAKQARYEKHLEELRRRFDEKDQCGVISLSAAAKYLHTDYRALLLEKHFPVIEYGKQYRVSLVDLAKWLTDKVRC